MSVEEDLEMMDEEKLKRRCQERQDAIVILPIHGGGFSAFVVDLKSIKFDLEHTYGMGTAPCPVDAARLAMHRADTE